VAACANIRAHIFSIPQKSLFDIKAMAGNIIPAIATTNAMVAGMIVIEALKIIDGQFDRCRSVFIRRQPTPRGKILVDAIPERPNPKCYVCSSRRELRVGLNLAEFTVRMLEERLLKGHLNMIAPDVTNDANGSVILSSEPGETEALLGKSLAELHVNSGAYLQCDDFRQQFELRLVLLQNDQLKGEDFIIVSDEGNTKESTDEETNEILPALGQKRAADDDVDLVAEGAKRARID